MDRDVALIVNLGSFTDLFIFLVQVEFWVSWLTAAVFQLSVHALRICTRNMC